MVIKLLHHREIDLRLWDEVVNQSINFLIYAESWYLNAVSPEWEALIGGNYEYLMPLPVKKKFGVKYIVQPVLTQQLGVFSKYDISPETFKKFIAKIPYLSYEMQLNEKNNFTDVGATRINLLLDLNLSANELQRNFAKNTLRNIAKAKTNKNSIDRQVNVDDFLEFYRNTETNYNRANIIITNKLLTNASKLRRLDIYGIRDENKKLIAALCLLKSAKRIINLLPISNEKGKKQFAMFQLIDAVIVDHAGCEVIFDFEGSMIEGVARFYRGFGAYEVHYPLIKRFRPIFLTGKL